MSAADASARARRSREKGAEGEREVARIFRENGWPQAKRTADGRAQEGRGDIADGPPHCHIEVKRVQRLNVAAAFKQVRHDARPLDVPILVHRPNNEEWMCTLPTRDLLILLNFAGGGRP